MSHDLFYHRTRVYRYAPELNKLHLLNRQTLPTPCITSIQEAITVHHPDYVNLSRLYRGTADQA
ncbi:hypothetical protein J2S82_003687 [Aeromonas caviae]|uniref:hypothetical protein n=1 Tax=Aeromonas caviae TaxID=648 RepID=UPI0020A0FE9F|nr:hypothetical protein [Aeromonas caviae]MCP1601730.1 hypothetical protein [Aeromonas caviae]